MTKTQMAQSAITGEWTQVQTYKVMLQHDAEVLEGDQLLNVVLQGAVLDEHVYQVEGGALPHRGRMAIHKTLRLKKVS